MKYLIGAIALLLTVDAVAQQPARPPRDLLSPGASRPSVAPAVITGRVTAADSRLPLRQAIVSATSQGAPPREAITDDRGMFQMTDLPPGAWQLTVSRQGYISRKFGQSRPFGRSAPIELAAGGQVNVEIPLTRASAIVGRIFDEFGEPITAARVTALRPTTSKERRYLEPVGESDSTDDTGAFRLHSLPAGEYYITASARIAPPDSSVQTTMAPTFYPGTVDFGAAQKVRVGAAAEAFAEFTLLPARNARVSGYISAAGGRVANAFVSLNAAAEELASTFGYGGVTREDGSFMMSEIPPGNYTLIAEIRTGPSTIAEIGTMPVTVSGADIENLSVSTSKLGTLRGTIVADAGVKRPLPQNIDVFARPRRAGLQNTFATATGTTFELVSPSGPFTLEAAVPNGWAVKSMTLGGLDATDLALDIAGEQGVPVTVVLTDRITEVSGTVAGVDGASFVVLFPADSSNWTARRVRMAQTDARGRFRIVGLPPGDKYLAVAVQELDEGQESDPEFLQQVVNAGTAFNLTAEEKRVIDLKVFKP